MLTLDSTLREAKKWLSERLASGEKCPCCGQMAKLYRRPLNANMARLLILAHRYGGQDWFHGPTLTKDGTGDLAKLRYWGLLDEEPTLRPDGGRAGWWKVTDLGERFAQGHVTIRKYAAIYDGKLAALEGEDITILDALGTKFRYDELMES